MSEIFLFIEQTEFVDLLHRSMEHGFALQMDKNLREPMPEYCRSQAELEQAIEGGQYAFLLERPDFTREPLRLRQIERDGSLFWYPRAAEGGPVVEVHFFAPFEKSGQKTVPCSSLSHQSKIINPHSGAQEVAGPGVKAALEEIVAPLRKVSRRVKSGGRSALVTPGVDSLLSAGWRLAPPFG